MHQEPSRGRKGTPGAVRRVNSIMRCALAVLVALSVLPVPSLTALTLTTITIDGDFSDWVGVRADTDNTVADTQIPDDPDWPSQPDRDVYLVGATYDEDYLYFSWRRTAGGTKAITFGAYLDYEGDGLLQDTDKVVMWTFSTGSPAASYANGTAHIFHYNQAHDRNGVLTHPAGDPMEDNHRDAAVYTGDGETPDGYANKQNGEDTPAQTMDGYLSPQAGGIEAEARVAWSDLGLTGPHPFAIHFASGNGESWGAENKPSTTYKSIGGGRYLEENRGQVEDNIGNTMYLLSQDVLVTPDNAAGGAAGETITYAHTVTNSGNATDTYDLAALSSQGWAVSITDAGGTPTTSTVLAAGASTTVYVHVTIPAGTADGTQDSTILTATSQDDSTVTDSATDTTIVGQVTVTPDQSASMAPGETVEYTYTLQNNTPSSGTFDLSTTSTLSFSNSIVDANGSPLSSVALASGESTTVVVQVSVPATATIGMQDTMQLTATEQTDPTLNSSATGVTTVKDELAISQVDTGYAGIGSFIQYSHTFTHSWPTTRTISLSAVSSAGWDVAFYAEDGVTEITEITIGPNGAEQTVIARIEVPSTAVEGDTDTTVFTASVDGYSVSVSDHTIVQALNTYASAGYVTPTDHYFLTDNMFARATGLSPGDDVYFVWKDPTGTIIRTSNDRTVDTQGMAFDEYETLVTDEIGWWTVELYSASDDSLISAQPLFVNYKGDITALSANDAPSIGDTITIDADLENLIGKDIDDSYIDYLIWWDSDGSGDFSAGDLYIDPGGGGYSTWDGTSTVTPTHTTTDVDVPGKTTDSDSWDISNTGFPNQGTYNVTATWYDSTGAIVIDEETTTFYSIPALGWPLFGLTIAGFAYFLWRKRDKLSDWDSRFAPGGEAT